MPIPMSMLLFIYLCWKPYQNFCLNLTTNVFPHMLWLPDCCCKLRSCKTGRMFEEVFFSERFFETNVRMNSDNEQRYWKKSFLGTSTFDIASSINMKQLFGFYKWAIPGLFFFNCVFSIHLIMHIGKFCQWLDSIRGSLVLKVTALPTAPQPLPNNC